MNFGDPKTQIKVTNFKINLLINSKLFYKFKLSYLMEIISQNVISCWGNFDEQIEIGIYNLIINNVKKTF
jgi:hypothetical protein